MPDDHSVDLRSQGQRPRSLALVQLVIVILILAGGRCPTPTPQQRNARRSRAGYGRNSGGLLSRVTFPVPHRARAIERPSEPLNPHRCTPLTIMLDDARIDTGGELSTKLGEMIGPDGSRLVRALSGATSGGCAVEALIDAIDQGELTE